MKELLEALVKFKDYLVLSLSIRKKLEFYKRVEDLEQKTPNFVNLYKQVDDLQKQVNTLQKQNISYAELRKLQEQIDAIPNDFELQAFKNEINQYVNSILENKTKQYVNDIFNEFAIKQEELNTAFENNLKKAIFEVLQSQNEKISRISPVPQNNNADIKNILARIENCENYAQQCRIKIKEQDAEINRLKFEKEQQSKEIERLEKEIEELKKQPGPSGDGGSEPPKKPVFTNDEEENSKTLKAMLVALSELRSFVVEKLYHHGSLEACLKLIDACGQKINALSVKHEKRNLSAESLAGEVLKIMKTTLAKLLGIEAFSKCTADCLLNCGFVKLDWKIGKVLKDDDYDYLEEPIFYEEVQDKNLEGSIVKIVQDGYLLYYLNEDEEIEESHISGTYCIGRLKR